MNTTMTVKLGFACAYVLSIILGNVFVSLFGLGTLSLFQTNNPDQVYFSLTFPLGVAWVGLTFSFRDFVQRAWGHYACWGWMLIAGFVTFLFNRNVALASIVAFMAAETTDWIVFYVMRKSTMKRRIIVSNILSCPIDSLFFVTIAFGLPWYSDAVWGQAIVKYFFGLLVIPLVPLSEKVFLKMAEKYCVNEKGAV